MNERQSGREAERMSDKMVLNDQPKCFVRKHEDLDVYKKSYETAMRIFQLTKTFPKEEKYSLTDQIRRSSRSVCANIAEAWRKRRYEAAFINRLGDSEAEAAETQTWIRFSLDCGYWDSKTADELYDAYDHVIAMLVRMISQVDKWTL